MQGMVVVGHHEEREISVKGALQGTLSVWYSHASWASMGGLKPMHGC